MAALIDAGALDQLLAPWVTDSAERQFVVRILADEGPLHHRAASTLLLRLLGQVLSAAGGPVAASDGPDLAVALRLPPHLAEHARGDTTYPLRLPTAPLERLAGGDATVVQAMADCLSDGPAHHALANVAMVCLIDALLRRLTPASE